MIAAGTAFSTAHIAPENLGNEVTESRPRRSVPVPLTVTVNVLTGKYLIVVAAVMRVAVRNLLRWVLMPAMGGHGAPAPSRRPVA